MQRANALPQLTLASTAAPAAEAAAAVGAKANNTFQFGLAFDRVRTATPASCCLVWSAWTDAHSACVCVCLLSVRVSLPPCVLVSPPLSPTSYAGATEWESVLWDSDCGSGRGSVNMYTCCVFIYMRLRLSVSVAVCVSRVLYILCVAFDMFLYLQLYIHIFVFVCAPRASTKQQCRSCIFNICK